MAEGIIVKALSGFYYVQSDSALVCCRAKGRFRHDGTSPLVGDRVQLSISDDGSGTVDLICPRKNSYIRPAVANIDSMVFVACGANPVTDHFLIDRVSVIAENSGCEFIVCINKCDLSAADHLYDIYKKAGFSVVCTSAVTGEGIEELKSLLHGKVCALTGNSGAGKSSLLNAMIPGLTIETADVSERLGRGKHTTRHVEFYSLDNKTLVADTPGFASFEVDMVGNIEKEQLPFLFREFAPYIGSCRFNDCCHLNEPDCSVLTAVKNGSIPQERHASYVKLYEIVKEHKPWE